MAKLDMLIWRHEIPSSQQQQIEIERRPTKGGKRQEKEEPQTK
jgi:hypothetical protein